MGLKSGRIQSDNIYFTCPQDGTPLIIEFDGEWKDGDHEGRTVYSQPFICRECGLLWSVTVRLKCQGSLREPRVLNARAKD